MSTETGPDLTDAVTAVTDLMDDTCLILRDAAPPGPTDAALDPEDLRLVHRGTDPTIVYDGRCKVRPAGPTTRTPHADSGPPQGAQLHTGAIPNTEIRPRRGDRLVLTSSRRNPISIGAEFRVTGDADISTFHVQWKFPLELRETDA